MSARNIDSFAKSPSAALRFTFVAAAYPKVRLHMMFCAPGPAKRGRAFYEAISLATFYEIINIGENGETLPERG
ncbi:MAG: hypothetical protein NTY64_17300 [Deltaproteobacteria bacterium]|nr:hypothetical protein [Deltaproteobacteria bacterium]